MLVTTWSEVEKHISDVTAADIAKCQRTTGPDGQVFWAVENERREEFEGEILKYQVRYSSPDGFSCTCKAAQYGRISHPSRVCKHCRWVVAAAIEERAASQPEPAAATAAQEAQEAQPLKPTPLTPQPNQEEAWKQAQEDRERRMKAPLNGNQGFRLER